MNICDYIIKHDLPHEKRDGKIIQNETLILKNQNISSLDGFIQNGYLDLEGNNITSLDGFESNYYYALHLCKWNTKLTEIGLKIGCKEKTFEEWEEFFNNKQSYETDPNSYKYEEIERIFNLYLEQYKKQ